MSARDTAATEVAHGAQERDAFDLCGLRAVVTGAARGIGLAAARALGRYGAELIIADVLDEELAHTREEFMARGVAVEMLATDVRSEADVVRLAEAAAALGGADVIVNAAGVMRRAGALDTTLEDLDAVWEVNVRGLYAVTQALLPQLVEKGAGKVINVGSLGSVLGLERRAAYAATKGAVRQYTQSLAVDLGKHGICVNAIAPGYIETDMSGDWLDGDGRRREAMLERILLGRFGRPSDLEGAFVFLAARASDYVTGQLLIVDGGWSSW